MKYLIYQQGARGLGRVARCSKFCAVLREPDDEYAAIVLSGDRIITEFEGTDVVVLKGRYGPYITDGQKNAKIPKDREPSSLTLEECQELIEKAPTRRGRKKKAAAGKKTTTKKKAAKKKTAARKKTPARKRASKKKAGSGTDTAG